MQINSAYRLNTLTIEIPPRGETKSCKEKIKEKITSLARALFCCKCRKSARVLPEENLLLSPIAKTLIAVASPRRAQEESLPSPFLEPSIATHSRKVKRPHTPELPVEITRLFPENSTVFEIPRENWEAISNQAETWGKVAKEKLTQFKAGRYREFSFMEIFENSMHICNSISHLIKTPAAERPAGSETWDTVLACRDTEGNIQSIALFDKESNSLAYIVTHPNNVHHRINANQAHGGATQIILYLARASLLTNLSLRLKSLESSNSFYTQRLKFQYDFSNPVTSLERSCGITALMLTTSKIRDLVDKKTPPFNQLT